MFGVRLPRALTVAFIDQALKASEGIADLSAAMRGLIAARTAVMTAVAAIDADMRRMTRASAACRRLMTIPGVGQLTALAFVAAIDDPSRVRRSRDIGAYLGAGSKAPSVWGGRLHRRHLEMRRQAGANLLYEAANVDADALQGPAQTQRLAFAIAKRSPMRKARVALARRLANHHARDAARTEPSSHRHKPTQSTRQEAEFSSPEERRPREGADDGANSVAWGHRWPTAISTEPPCTQLTPSSAERARRERRHPQSVDTRESLSPLTH